MFTLDPLPYAFDALEVAIDKETMIVHHDGHHQSYIDKANAALNGTQWENSTAKEILTNLDSIPENIKSAVRNNVGGLCNHNFFWQIMSPKSSETPEGTLGQAIDQAFGSFSSFQEKFIEAAIAQFGSGWVWLVLKNDQLSIISTPNQDSPLSLGYTRVLGADVWEHAYYLRYRGKRPDYLKAWWQVVNWEKAEEFFTQGGV